MTKISVLMWFDKRKSIFRFNVHESGAAAGFAAGGTYTVQRGDSLWKIAAKVYGNGRRWREIYEANADKLSDASRIYAGQVLVIPK